MIQIRDLQKVIDGQTVIDIPKMDVAAGEVAALAGSVGSGKRALFTLLTGRERPTMGSVRLADIDPFADHEHFSRQVGVLFAEDNLYQRQSVYTNLKFYSRLYRLPAERIQQVLEQVGLADQAHVQVGKLTPSLVRRLSFGRAIIHRPTVLVLAEPFADCTDESIALIGRLIREQAADGAAVLLLSSSRANLVAHCDTIHRLEHGRIVESLRPQEESTPALPFMIPAKLEGKVALVDPADILYVFAQDDRAHLQTVSDRLPTQFTLAELEKRLIPSGFFRAHRSYLVNLQHVKEVIPYTRDSYTLRLKDPNGAEIPLTKSAARDLRDLLGY